MKDKIKKLHDFMEHLHKKWAECAPDEEKWADCDTVEAKLRDAQEALEEGGYQEELDELTDVIIPELEQMKKVCSLPAQITDDDALWSVRP